MFRGARSLSSSASSIVKKSLFLPQTSFSMRANGPISEPKLQPEICDRLYKWQDSRADSELWVLHDGPPYANGDLHIGHFLNKVLKDIVNRYKLLRGCRIHYVPGWDCHGLPIELKALEKARKNCKSGVLSPQEIRNLAREWAQKHVESQKKEFRRWGILADWENAYKTMDKEYEALQIKVFRNLVERGFVYRALKPVYWSPSSQTALAEAELEYVDDHVSQAAYVGYSLTEKAREKISELVSSSEILHKLSGNIQAVIWTTTPWTIPASMAVAFGRDLEYAILRDKTNGNCLLVAKDCVKNLEHFEFEEIFILSGKHLSGLVARHPFLDREVPFLESEFVLADSGTGLVHTAPGHGREDFIIGQRNDLPTVSVVNENGQFTSAAGKDLEGLKVIFNISQR